MHPVFALFGFGECRMDPITGDGFGRGCANIAVNDFIIGALGAPEFDEFGTQAAAVGTVLFLVGPAGAGAAVDVQDRGHDILLRMILVHPFFVR